MSPQTSRAAQPGGPTPPPPPPRPPGCLAAPLTTTVFNNAIKPYHRVAGRAFVPATARLCGPAPIGAPGVRTAPASPLPSVASRPHCPTAGSFQRYGRGGKAARLVTAIGSRSFRRSSAFPPPCPPSGGDGRRRLAPASCPPPAPARDRFARLVPRRPCGSTPFGRRRVRASPGALAAPARVFAGGGSSVLLGGLSVLRVPPHPFGPPSGAPAPLAGAVLSAALRAGAGACWAPAVRPSARSWSGFVCVAVLPGRQAAGRFAGRFVSRCGWLVVSAAPCGCCWAVSVPVRVPPRPAPRVSRAFRFRPQRASGRPPC
jgi:hypothetical protein